MNVEISGSRRRAESALRFSRLRPRCLRKPFKHRRSPAPSRTAPAPFCRASPSTYRARRRSAASRPA